MHEMIQLVWSVDALRYIPQIRPGTLLGTSVTAEFSTRSAV